MARWGKRKKGGVTTKRTKKKMISEATLSLNGLTLFVDENFECNSAIAVVHLVLLDVLRIRRLADDLQENTRRRLGQFDKHQRTQISLLSDIRVERQIDAVLREILDRSHVVLIGGVFSFAFEFEVIAGSDFRNKLEDLVELDGEARRAVLEAEVVVDAVVHDVLEVGDLEAARARVPFGVGFSGAVLATVLEILVILSLGVGAGGSVGVEEVVEVDDVVLVRFGVGLLVLDQGLVLIRTRSESHTWVLWQYGVRSGEERRFVIGEGIEEDGKKSSEKSRQTGIVDEVEKADLRPTSRSTGENSTRLFVVNHVAHTHLAAHTCVCRDARERANTNREEEEEVGEESVFLL